MIRQTFYLNQEQILRLLALKQNIIAPKEMFTDKNVIDEKREKAAKELIEDAIIENQNPI